MNSGNPNVRFIIVSRSGASPTAGQEWVDVLSLVPSAAPPERVLFPDAEEAVKAVRRLLAPSHASFVIPARSKYH